MSGPTAAGSSAWRRSGEAEQHLDEGVAVDRGFAPELARSAWVARSSIISSAS
jgi:hypothetical protein